MKAAVRNTRDVDIALNRRDLEAATQVMQEAGLVFRRVRGVSMFLDGPEASARDAVHIVFAGEKVRGEYPEAVPSIEEAETIDDLRTMPLESLVRKASRERQQPQSRRKIRQHLRE